jgi:hypothetical protein
VLYALSYPISKFSRFLTTIRHFTSLWLLPVPIVGCHVLSQLHPDTRRSPTLQPYKLRRTQEYTQSHNVSSVVNIKITIPTTSTSYFFLCSTDSVAVCIVLNITKCYACLFEYFRYGAKLFEISQFIRKIQLRNLLNSDNDTMHYKRARKSHITQ